MIRSIRPCPSTILRTTAFLWVCTLSACALKTAPVLDPQGPIAMAQRELLFAAAALMLIVIVPVFVLAFWVVHRYRESRQNPAYRPDWSRSSRIEATIWLIPALIVIALAFLLWQYTHKLDPYREIASDQPAVNVQAVALDWKWLFIYPDLQVAALNELAFPVDTPVNLIMTSDTVMNSFAVPALAGQVYVMAGMQTELHLLANRPGSFAGRNLQYSGKGFPDQTFVARALPARGFAAWLEHVRQSSRVLDAATYQQLTTPTRAQPVMHYREVSPGLFESIVRKYTGQSMPYRAATTD